MVIDLAIWKQGPIYATWLWQNWNILRTISTHVEFSKAVLHESSDTTEVQCLHNSLPSLPNLPKCGLYYMGLAQNRWHTTPSVSLSFFMSSPSFLTRITELSSCAQDRVASHCMSVVAGFVVWNLNWRTDVLTKKSVVFQKWFKSIFWCLCW